MFEELAVSIVEDYWRLFIGTVQQDGFAAGQKCTERFEDRIAEIANSLGRQEAAEFLKEVEQQRERLLTEYDGDPVKLKRRLGISLGVDAPHTSDNQIGQGLGDLAVRTAVRATIWETVRALFRAAR